MNNIEIFNKLLININDLYNYSNDNNLINLFTELNNFQNENVELKKKLSILESENINLNNIIIEYKKENIILDNNIKKKELEIINKDNTINQFIEDNKNFKKVSYTQQLTKQISELTEFIKDLEIQLKKYKNDKLENVEYIKNLENELKELKLNNKELKLDNIDYESIDIDGYELLSYKNNYYLKNDITNELYNIKNRKPYKIIGIIKPSGKVKFNN